MCKWFMTHFWSVPCPAKAWQHFAALPVRSSGCTCQLWHISRDSRFSTRNILQHRRVRVDPVDTGQHEPIPRSLSDCCFFLMACLSSQCVHFHTHLHMNTHLMYAGKLYCFFFCILQLQSVVIFSLLWHLGVLWLSESSGNLDRLIRLVIVDEFVYMLNLCFFFVLCVSVCCMRLSSMMLLLFFACFVCLCVLCCFVLSVCVGPTPAYSCKKQNSWRESGTGSTPQSLSTPSQTPPSTRPTFIRRRRVRHGRPTGPSPLRLPASPPRPPHRHPRHRPRRAAAGLPSKSRRSRGSRRRRERTQTQKTVQSSAWLKVNKPRQTKPLQRQKVRLHAEFLPFFPFSLSLSVDTDNHKISLPWLWTHYLSFLFFKFNLSLCHHVWPLKVINSLTAKCCLTVALNISGTRRNVQEHVACRLSCINLSRVNSTLNANCKSLVLKMLCSLV